VLPAVVTPIVVALAAAPPAPKHPSEQTSQHGSSSGSGSTVCARSEHHAGPQAVAQGNDTRCGRELEEAEAGAGHAGGGDHRTEADEGRGCQQPGPIRVIELPGITSLLR